MLLACLAMVAFAANSLLCRAALTTSNIDPVSFTGIRLLSGALVLAAIVVFSRAGKSTSGISNVTKPDRGNISGSWLSAAALFIYAAGFSFAYRDLSTATGALILFGSVQITMLACAYAKGERMKTVQKIGSVLASLGLLVLLLPGLSSPPLNAAVLMILAGVAWAAYTLRGRVEGDPTESTMGNFIRSVPLVFAMILISIIFSPSGLASIQLDNHGIIYAVLSGAIASGIGYAIWYSALPHLTANNAAVMQLSVPVIAGIAGALFLSEPITLRLLICAVIILGGIALVVSPSKATV